MSIESVVGVTLASADPEATTQAYRVLAASVSGAGVRIGGLDVQAAPVVLGQEPGVAAVHLGVVDLPVTTRLLERRGVTFVDADLVDLAGLRWRLVEVAPEATNPAATGEGHDLVGLDHVVVATDDPERAVAEYGARLGLDLRLDRRAPQWRMRGLFFRCGEAVVEVVAPLDPPEQAASTDAFAGLAWRSADLDATRARLVAAGLDVSEIRDGRKAGTRVLTIRDPRLVTPSLVIGA